MRVKLFSVAAATPIQSLENDINEFLESERPHVTYVSVSSSDIERVRRFPSGMKSRIIGVWNRRWRNWFF